MKFFRQLVKEIFLCKLDYTIVAVAMILTGLIRFSSVWDGGFPFLFDHGRDMLEVKKIVVEHNPTFIGPFTGLKGVFQGPLHYYLLTIPFILSGGNPAANIFMMASLGVLGTLLCYVLGREMYGRLFGIIASIFFALSPTSISFSTIFWNPYWIPFCMIFYYYFLHKGIFKDTRYLALCGLTAGIISQFELAFGGNLIIVLSLLCVVFVRNFYTNRYFWFALLLFLLSFSSQALFDLKNDFLMSRSVLQLLSGQNESLGEAIPFSTRLIYRLDELNKATVRTVSGEKFFQYVFVAFFLSYCAYLLVNKRKAEWKDLFLWISAPLWFFCFFLLYPRAAWEWYWVGLQVSYYFLLAYVLSRTMRMHQILLSGIIVMLSIWGVFTYSRFWGHFDVVNNNPGTFRNEVNLIDAIYKDSAGKPFGVFVYTPPIYDYNYNYLFWWRGTKYYNYVPNQNKDGLFYLIIEKDDPKNPYGSDGWQKTVIKSGKIIWSKSFPGDVVVQRREGAKI